MQRVIDSHITEAAEQLRRIIDSLSLPSTPRDAEVQPLDAAALLTTVFTMLGFSARAAGVRLTVDMPLRVSTSSESGACSWRC